MGIARRIVKWLGILLVVLLASAYGFLWWLFGTSSVTTHGDMDLGPGNVIVPTERTRTWAERSALTDSIEALFAAKEVRTTSRDGKKGQLDRAIIGKLASGRDVANVNEILQRMKPWGIVGSRGPFLPAEQSGYDFALNLFTLILYAFGDQPHLLYPATTSHIVDVMMTEDGGTPKPWTPRVLWLPLRDTENHLLMGEGSRFLKNQWKASHGDNSEEYDNANNGLESWLLDYLGGMERMGFQEYNSRPYLGYSLTPLVSMASFARGPVRDAATRVLDRVNWEYALGSLSFRRFPPFRRQPGRASQTDLDGDYHTTLMKAWMSLAGVEGQHIRTGAGHALFVGLTSYRPTDAVAQWVLRKPSDYFVQMSHGWDGSPEIYSGGPGYLITAGGVARDRFKQAVARPTTLMLEDGVMDLSGLLHIRGKGKDFRKWNNTGVHRDFAVAKGRLHVPDDWEPIAGNEIWKIYDRAGKRIATHANDDLGLFCLLVKGHVEDQLARLTEANPDPGALRSRFQWPGASLLLYYVNSSTDMWVMVSVDGKELDRDHGTWPLMQGDVPGWNR